MGVLVVLLVVSLSISIDSVKIRDASSCGSELGGCSGRGLCMNNKCICFAGSGDRCEVDDVDIEVKIECVHGLSYKQKCKCEAGWEGERCEKPSCECSGHGKCVDKTCQCEKNWGGSHCRIPKCDNDCSGHGYCGGNHECVCVEGWTSSDCSKKECPMMPVRENGNDIESIPCAGHGKCDLSSGSCACEPEWTGAEDCSLRTKNVETQRCPLNCENAGYCHRGTCYCKPGFSGRACQIRIGCPNDCNGHKCNSGVCECEKPFTGIDCSYMGDENMCSLRGLFSTREKSCLCFPGFTGEHCEKRQCSMNCNGRGTCGSNGQCFCSAGYTGPSCELKTCPGNDCAGHGKCNRKTGKCTCEEGWTSSEDCSVPECARPCENGICIHGKCLCAPGYRGSSCSVRTCPKSCSQRGYCNDGVCKCFENFDGDACEFKLCPLDCSGSNGNCDRDTGKCVCENGYFGDSCEFRSCTIAGCSGHGKCNGETHRCECETHFGGIGCSVANTCTNSCSSHGTCTESLECICDEGYSGDSCSEGCSGCKGVCHDSKCFCPPGVTGEKCTKKLCPDPSCSSHGFCDTDKGKCVCDNLYHGDSCEKKRSCKNDCSNHGRCLAVEGTKNSTSNSMKCFCDREYIGEACENRRCHEGCVEEKGAVCEDGICYCLNDGSEDAMMCTHRLDILEKTVVSAEEVQEEEKETNPAASCVHGVLRNENKPHDADRSFKPHTICECIQGWTGEACDQKACESNCSFPFGLCENGQCHCSDGRTGSTCSEEVGELGYCGPAHTCSGHGTCDVRKRICVCDFGFAGLACDSHVCPGTTINTKTNEYVMCAGNGACDRSGKCHCDTSYFGEDCSCEKECLNGGVCLDGACKCEKGFDGEFCEHTSCNNDCHLQGKCVISQQTGEAFCECFDGFSSDDCSVRTCPRGCSGNGLCEESICLCYAGFLGASCELRFDPSSEGALRTVSTALEEDFSTFLDVTARFDNQEDSTSRELVDESRQILRRLDADVQTLVQVADLIPAKRIRGSDSKFEKMDMSIVRSAAKAATETLGETSQDIAAHSNYTHATLVKRLNSLLESVSQGKLSTCPRAHDGETCGHGRCECNDESVCSCVCDTMWSGKACQVQDCLNNCSEHGTCTRGSCECEEGYSSIDCSVKDDVTCRKACMSRCLLQCSTSGEQPDRASHHSCYDECFQPCIQLPGCSSDKSVGRHEIAHGYALGADVSL